jgi:hypothetical protein
LLPGWRFLQFNLQWEVRLRHIVITATTLSTLAQSITAMATEMAITATEAGTIEITATAAGFPLEAADTGISAKQASFSAPLPQSKIALSKQAP